VKSIGLKDYAENLLESGIHGSLIALDDSFNAASMALALRIPPSNTQVCAKLHCISEYSGIEGQLSGNALWDRRTAQWVEHYGIEGQLSG